MKRTTLPRSASGVRWDGLALGVDGPGRPPLRAEVADGRRLVLFQGDQTVLLARQRVTHRGVHYARTGRYTSPVPPLRAEAARAYQESCPDEDAWLARWAHHFATALRESANGPLHEGDWQLTRGLPPGGTSPRTGHGCRNTTRPSATSPGSATAILRRTPVTCCRCVRCPAPAPRG